MKADVTQQFERFCRSKNASPKSVTEMEALLRDFFAVLNQDLIRTFYLNGFSGISADVPKLIEPLQSLITEIPGLQDPRFQSIQKLKNNITPQRAAMFEEYQKLYKLCANEELIAFQDDPTHENLVKLAKEFELKEWMQAFTSLESSATKVYDTRYHQISKKFFADLNKIRGQIENSSLQKSQAQAIIHHLFSTYYQVYRRAEIGKELTDLALTGHLSFLCYAEVMAKPDEELGGTLSRSLVISQWDWLHDNKLLQKELFINLRKGGIDELKKELQDRIEMVKLLKKLNKNKWIDPKQSEIILKNSCTQRAAKSLDTLQFFLIKKEVVPLVHARAKGAPDESEIKNRLAALIKPGPNPELKEFYNKLLNGAETLQERISHLTIDVIRNLLTPPKNTPFDGLRNKILDTPKKAPVPTAVPSSKTPPPAAPRADAPTAGSDGILQEIAELQKQLLEGANVMDELMSNHQGEQAIAFLENRQILLPDTEQAIRKKLNILQQHIKDGPKGVDPMMMLGKLKIEIRNSMTLDTKLFALREKLKLYEEKPNLTSEETEMIRNSDLPAQERLFMVDLCSQKYHFLNELSSSVPEKERFTALELEKASPALINILQDILKEQPFYFSKAILDSFKNCLPKFINEDVEASRKSSLALFENSIGDSLFSKLVQWGLWKVKGTEQSKLIEVITSSLSAKSVNTQKWNKFKTVNISKKSLEGIAQSIPPKLEEIMDDKGRTILSNMKRVVFKNDEEGIKNFPKSAINYLANSLITTDYITQIRDLFESFSKISGNSNLENIVSESNAESPTGMVKHFEGILEMEFHDQRLEILLDELMLILPEDSPLIETGKKLYFELTGFQY
ncbi:MAG: hypothetical protein HQM13_03520 [SAR324 cluster bacterium]|nr:hypothetical protein [SAR324 cluster bacterium]